MIGVMALVAVTSWKVLDVLGWLGGRETRRIERWISGLFAADVLIPLYAFHDLHPLTAVVEEIVEPIRDMLTGYIDRISK